MILVCFKYAEQDRAILSEPTDKALMQTSLLTPVFAKCSTKMRHSS